MKLVITEIIKRFWCNCTIQNEGTNLADVLTSLVVWRSHFVRRKPVSLYQAVEADAIITRYMLLRGNC